MALQLNTTLVPGTTIIYDDTNGGIAVDYTLVLTDIAGALIDIKQNLDNLESLSNDTKRIADYLEVIKSNSDSLPDIAGSMTGPDSTSNLTAINQSVAEMSDSLARIVGDDSTSPLTSFDRIADVLEKFVGDDSTSGLTSLDRIADALEQGNANSPAESQQRIVEALEALVVLSEKELYQFEKLSNSFALNTSTFVGSVEGNTLTVETLKEGTVLDGMELINPLIKLRTSVVSQLTYTNQPDRTVTASSTGSERLVLPSTENIFVGQFVAGQGCGAEPGEVENATTVVGVENTAVILSSPLTESGSFEYTFTSPGREGTYELTQEQDEPLTSEVFVSTKGSNQNVKPYDWVNLVPVYKLLLEENTLGEGAPVFSPDRISKIKRTIIDYIERVKDLPKTTE
jgi:hypothetical protein